MSRSWSYFSSDMVLISLYIKRRNKDGALTREQRSFELRRLIDHLR